MFKKQLLITWAQNLGGFKFIDKHDSTFYIAFSALIFTCNFVNTLFNSSEFNKNIFSTIIKICSRCYM